MADTALGTKNPVVNPTELLSLWGLMFLWKETDNKQINTEICSIGSDPHHEKHKAR